MSGLYFVFSLLDFCKHVMVEGHLEVVVLFQEIALYAQTHVLLVSGVLLS